MIPFRHPMLAAFAAIFLSTAAQAADPDQARLDRQTRDLLDQLKVNEPGGVTPHTPIRDRATNLRAGTSEVVELPVGGARTIAVPGSFDKAVVVIPDVADVIVMGPGRVQIIARKPGSTDLVLSAPDGATYKAHVVVAADAAPVQAAISAALPDENIRAAAANGAILLTGSTRDATAAATAIAIARRFAADPTAGVVDSIQVLGGQQVMLRVRVAEVNRTIEKQLGLNTALGSTNGTAVFGSNPNLAAYGAGSATSTVNTTGGVSSIAALATATNPIGFISTKAFGSVFTSVASALESQGLVRTLAEPNLVTQSGKTASMLAGSEYPVPSISQSGRTGTEYRNFGVSLSFTPTVLSADSINLDIATEVSTRAENVTFPDGAGGTFNVPVFNTRKANSTVTLPSGGSIVIAGLVSSDFQNTLSGIPGLKDLPILGKLFSSADFQRNETELVVSVTAYLVQPTDDSRIAEPSAGLQAPTDLDLYLLNKLTGTAPRPLAPPPSGVQRDFGYITE